MTMTQSILMRANTSLPVMIDISLLNLSAPAIKAIDVKGLVNLQKTFFKLLLIEKPVMRETECQKPHKKSK